MKYVPKLAKRPELGWVKKSKNSSQMKKLKKCVFSTCSLCPRIFREEFHAFEEIKVSQGGQEIEEFFAKEEIEEMRCSSCTRTIREEFHAFHVLRRN